MTSRTPVGEQFTSVLDAARAGAEWAWRVLYENLTPSVLGYLRSRGAPDPEGVCGEVFRQLVRDIHRFEGDEGGFRSWVFVMAHHRLLDDLRRRSRRPEAPAAESLSDIEDSMDVEAGVVGRDEASELRGIIEEELTPVAARRPVPADLRRPVGRGGRPGRGPAFGCGQGIAAARPGGRPAPPGLRIDVRATDNVIRTGLTRPVVVCLAWWPRSPHARAVTRGDSGELYCRFACYGRRFSLKLTLRRLVLALSILLLGTLWGINAITRNATAQGNEDVESEPLSSLQCQSTDLIFDGEGYIVDLPDDARSEKPGRSSNAPSEALRDHVRRAYPRLNPARFSERSRASDRATFHANEQGRLVAIASVINVDERWTVERFTACNSFLLKQVDPSDVGGRR